MCDPLTIAAGAMMLGGSYANYRGQRQSQKATVNMRRAEDARQEGYRQQAEVAYARNKDLYDPERAKGEMKESAKERTDAYAAASMAAPRVAAAASSGKMGGNKVVQEANAARLSDGSARATEHGAAGAQLQSLGDMLFSADLSRLRNRDDINMAANFARGSLNPLSAELEAAQRKGDKMRALGSLLSSAGSVAAMAAGAKAGGAGFESATTGSPSIFMGSNGGYVSPFGNGYINPYVPPRL